MKTNRTYDVIIIGAGPSGISSAIADSILQKSIIRLKHTKRAPRIKPKKLIK